MDCPFCRKGRLKRLRTFIEGDRVRRENICPKCHHRPVTIEMHEVVYLEELQEREQKAADLEREQQHYINTVTTMRHHASEVFSFLFPTPSPAVPVKTPKKCLSSKKTRNKNRK